MSNTENFKLIQKAKRRDPEGESVNKIIRKMVDFKTETFANAREVRNLYEDIIRNQRNRLH